MATNPDTAAPKLRWLRALVAAIVAEVALICVAIPVYSSMPQADATALLSLIVPPASFVVFVAGTSVTDGFTPAYLLAHALKIAGGAVGGWWVSRKVSAA